jgi:glycosyltransferase involved in cell wall biosynthesis
MLEKKPMTVCLVSPFPPPYGGMAIQATKLIPILEAGGMAVLTVKTNTDFPSFCVFLKKIPGVRTAVNSLLFLLKLHGATRQADVVYFLSGFFNFFFWVTYPALVLCKLAGIPVVLSARGGDAARFFSRWKLLIAPIIRRIDLITTPSGFLQKAFIDAFAITPMIVPNIADVEQFRFRERTVLAPRLIVTRSLEEIYNVGCVIKAFALVHKRFPEATLAVVGDGSQRRMLEEMAAKLGVFTAVTFHGRVDHAQIQALYDANDISVNASNVDNLPGTILEAFACGLPVVSSRAGGIPYIVEDGVTGLLVDRNDCRALSEQVLRLLEHPQLAQKLIINGYNDCRRYSANRVSEVLLPMLETVVKHQFQTRRPGGLRNENA